MKRKRAASMAMVAEWYKLPEDILNLISERIEDQLDLINFRSVCSSWRRSSISVNHRSSPFIFKFNLPPYHNECNLSKHTLLLIKPSPKQQEEEKKEILRPWLIRITQNSHGKNQLIYPLLSGLTRGYAFPHVLDFTKFSVVQLGNDLILDKHYIKNKVVAVTCRSKNNFIIATLNDQGHPELFRCGDDSWKLICDLTSIFFLDICVFKRRFYVVNKSGRTFAIEPEDYSVQLVAESVVDGGGDIKFLVESKGNLLLVDIYDCKCFDLFRLDMKKNRWVKLKSLGDRVLFLGNGCSFSASASDLSFGKGNRVIYVNDVFPYTIHKKIKCGMRDFHRDKVRISYLSEYSHHSNLFWPPPKWIRETCMDLQS